MVDGENVPTNKLILNIIDFCNNHHHICSFFWMKKQNTLKKKKPRPQELVANVFFKKFLSTEIAHINQFVGFFSILICTGMILIDQKNCSRKILCSLSHFKTDNCADDFEKPRNTCCFSQNREIFEELFIKITDLGEKKTRPFIKNPPRHNFYICIEVNSQIFSIPN